MKRIELGKSGVSVPVVALGCMRMSGLEPQAAQAVVATALEAGIDFFDHADIYGGGKSEEVFAQAVKALKIPREKLILQSKCGVRKGMYDFSTEHILSAVEGSLARLQTDYLDVLLLHRPDALCEPECVKEAFSRLYAQGKVRAFGVSNHNPYQIELLTKALGLPIVANQLQFSITNASMVAEGMNVNTMFEYGVVRDGDILNYCRLNDITIQPWSPFQYGFFEGVFLGNEKFQSLNDVINQIAGKYGVTNTTIAIAWILRHPANMQPIVGTMSPQRLKDIAAASDVRLSREDWYEIYRAAGYTLP
jgi:predicted oxidoreductase